MVTCIFLYSCHRTYVRSSLSNHILDPKAPEKSFTVTSCLHYVCSEVRHRMPWHLHRTLQEYIPLNSISNQLTRQGFLIFARLRKTALHFMCPRHEIALATRHQARMNKGLDICFAPDWYKSNTTNQVPLCPLPGSKIQFLYQHLSITWRFGKNFKNYLKFCILFIYSGRTLRHARILVPQPGIKPTLPALDVWSLNPGLPRQSPQVRYFRI